jgi:hypothetical protein
MNIDEYKSATPETFGGINDEFTECDCWGALVSPNNTNEAPNQLWLCGKCFSEWE